jgi:hypothetical protein
MMSQDEELHTRIMQAFREYFKANQDWINKGTRRAGMDTRYWLNEIRVLCEERRKHIMDWRKDLDHDKFERKRSQKEQQSR